MHMARGVCAAWAIWTLSMRARRAPFEVPMMARSGVIQAMFFVFVSSAVISAGFYWI